MHVIIIFKMLLEELKETMIIIIQEIPAILRRIIHINKESSLIIGIIRTIQEVNNIKFLLNYPRL